MAQSLQRHVSHRHAHRRRASSSTGGLMPAVAAPARHPGEQGARVRRHRQDRPHPPAGRDAADPRAGVLRLGRAARPRARPRSRPRCRASIELALGGTAVGTGLNAHAGFADARRGRDRASSPGCPFVTRAQQVRGAGRPRRARVRRTARSRRWPRLADQDRQRRALARLAARAAGSASSDPAGERAGQLDHAGQGQPHPVRGPDDGVRPGDGQRRRDRRSAARRATSSSTSSSR